jgi:hypothetical protein
MELSASDYELRNSWRAKALLCSSGKTHIVLLSILADAYDDLIFLLKAIYPGFQGIGPPSLVSSGRINWSGKIIAKYAGTDGTIRWAPLYKSEIHLRDEFRKFADRLQLNDAERVELFGAIGVWLNSDLRLDPNMDPRDPDAKRLVH